MKILIMSFPRSGTSLTFRVFNQHYDIHKKYFETLLLWRHNEETLQKDFGFTKENNCLEKIIYENLYIGKTKEFSYIDYCDLWNERFGKEARIIQIVRHPYDQWNSIIQYKYQKLGINYKQPLYKGSKREDHRIVLNLKRYFNCVPKYTEKIMSYPNSISIKYEDLLERPDEIIKILYKFSNLNPKRTRFKEQINKRKRFFYKEYGHRIDNEPSLKQYSKAYWKVMNENIHKVLDVYNKIEGPKYEV